MEQAGCAQRIRRYLSYSRTILSFLVPHGDTWHGGGEIRRGGVQRWGVKPRILRNFGIKTSHRAYLLHHLRDFHCFVEYHGRLTKFGNSLKWFRSYDGFTLRGAFPPKFSATLPAKL